MYLVFQVSYKLQIINGTEYNHRHIILYAYDINFIYIPGYFTNTTIMVFIYVSIVFVTGLSLLITFQMAMMG